MRAIFVDIEGSMLPIIHPWQKGSFICSIGIAYERHLNRETDVWVLRHATDTVRPQADSLAEIQKEIDKADLIVAHNAKFDVNWLKTVGLNLAGKKIWCTQVAEYLIQGQFPVYSYSLNNTAARYGLGQKEDQMAEYWKLKINTDHIPLSVHIPYLKQDCALVRDIYERQLPIIDANGLGRLAALSFDIADVLSDIELAGIGFDEKKARQFLTEYRSKIDVINSEIFGLVGYEFKIKSPDQLSSILYGGYVTVEKQETYTVTLKSGEVKEKKRNIKVKEFIPGFGIKPIPGSEKKKEGYYSTDKKTLKLLHTSNNKQKQLINALLERSKVSKIIDTFQTKSEDSGLLHKIGVDCNIHPQFNQTVTVSGRLSSKDPNGQNLPRGSTSPVKKCFIPRNDCFLNLDLAQIEFRIAAELSRDPVMLGEINDGIDTHADNAIKFFGADKFDKNSDEFKKLRTTAKVFTFGLLYGRTVHGFVKDPTMPKLSAQKWEQIINAYYAKYSVLQQWQKANVRRAYDCGYLRNPSGRVLRFVAATKNGMTGFNEADIYNYPVQSSSADIMFLAMSSLRRRMREHGFRSKIVLQVHDSLVIDAHFDEVERLASLALDTYKDIPKLCKEFWGWDMIVPIAGDCEIGLTYGDMVGYDVKPDVKSLKCVFVDGDIKFEQEFAVTSYGALLKDEGFQRMCYEHKLTKIKAVS